MPGMPGMPGLPGTPGVPAAPVLPPHPATIAVSSNAVDHTSGLLIFSNLFILFSSLIKDRSKNHWCNQPRTLHTGCTIPFLRTTFRALAHIKYF
jgi:hypothetical protein